MSARTSRRSRPMAALISKDSPRVVKVLAAMFLGGLIVTGVVVLPLLLWVNTHLNLSALGILLNEHGYTRETFQITEYGYSMDGAGEFMSTEHYFFGTVRGKPETMKTTFAAYSPDLRLIMGSGARGRTPVNIAIEVWYNPDMRHAWLGREQGLLPYTPDFFSSLYPRLAGYLLLWVLFAVVWLSLYWLPKIRAGATQAARSR